MGDLNKLVEAAELLSRTEFPGVLRKLGLEGRPNALRADAGLPVGVEERLSHLGYTEPFAAVRALHEAIRTDGESPTRLAGLVRSYALLGILTEHFWHPAHKAFKARALLYAQRMTVRDPKGSYGLWHRAYAESLLGLHKHALADIVQARANGPRPPVSRSSPLGRPDRGVRQLGPRTHDGPGGAARAARGFAPPAHPRAH